MSSQLMGKSTNINNNNNTSVNISTETLDKANKAKEIIENYYSDLVRLKQERNDRLQKINNLLNQEKLSEEEKLKESSHKTLKSILHSLLVINILNCFNIGKVL